ncbi:DMT family transporter [Staphylospora marina]|uniref:DMT family transporter n=1 Tax=Staphylospora marina TaxID=2490858 RepID=UPI000F5BA1C2|nr:DMT family transporter [Staphylospora marina]
MPSHWLLILFALIAGIVLPFQFSVNAQLRNAVGSPLSASAISFLTGTMVLVLAVVLTRQPVRLTPALQAPSWIWTGGLLGAFYVFATVILIPKLGAGTTVALVLTGQVIASLFIDHFGLLQVPVHSLTPGRLVGALLIIAGVILVQKS